MKNYKRNSGGKRLTLYAISRGCYYVEQVIMFALCGGTEMTVNLDEGAEHHEALTCCECISFIW